MKTFYKRNSIFLLFITVLLSVSEISCTRKAEDDPFISFRSRKNRVVGTWKATEGKITTDLGHSSFKPMTWYYNGVSEVASSIIDPFFSSERSYLTEVEFKKDGSFEWVMIHTDTNGVTQRGSYSGKWDLIKGSKTIKDKTELVLNAEITEGIWPDHNYLLFPERQDIPLFTIRELRHDKIVIHREYEVMMLPNPASYNRVCSYSEEWTLEPR